MFKTNALGSPLLACGSQWSRWDGGDQPDCCPCTEFCQGTNNTPQIDCPDIRYDEPLGTSIPNFAPNRNAGIPRGDGEAVRAIAASVVAVRHGRCPN